MSWFRKLGWESYMAVRPFDWRDLPALHRHRNQVLFLDSTRLLTQGPRLIPAGALFSYFAPATGIFTYRCTGGGKSNGEQSRSGTLLGQVVHPAGSASARLSFIAPVSGLESDSLPKLLELITTEIGERGGFHLLADVDEQDPAFEHLRKAGFGIYARQRIWQLTGAPKGDPLATLWRAGSSRDSLRVRALYNDLVPGLVQQVEPPPANRPRGLVYLENGELLAYIEIRYGPRGIWAQPFIHPDAEKVTARLVDLMRNLPYRRGRPVYFCVRSYQSWLESAIEELGAEAGPRQAVMVKRLALPQRALRPYVLPALEGGHPEVTAPITNSRVVRNYDTTSNHR
jgi:hypothetical protein